MAGGAVHFVGKHDIGENRSFARREFAFAGVVNESAGDVGGQQVGGELDTPERCIEATGQRDDGKRFPQSRHAFDEHVVAGDERRQQSAQEVRLADDDSTELLTDAVDPEV